MREKRDKLRMGMILIAFGVCLYCLLQNLGDVAGALQYIYNILYPIVLGCAMAFVFNVLMSPLERLLGRLLFLKKRHRLLRVLSLVLTLLGAAAVIVLVVLVIVPRLGEAVGLFAAVLPQSSRDLTENLQELLRHFAVSEEIIGNLSAYIGGVTQQILDLIKQSSGAIANRVLSTVVSAFTTVMNVVFALIVAIYILADKERIGCFVHRCMCRFMPEKHTERITRVASLSFATFANFVRGQLLEALILGMMCFLGMLIFGFPYAAVVSLLLGVMALIPFFGAWIGGATAAVLVASVDPFKGVMMVVFIVVLQQIEGNLIYPRVVGSTIGMPGLLVMVAVIMGQGLFGVFGILISVPLCAVCYTLLKQHLDDAPAPAENGEAPLKM